MSLVISVLRHGHSLTRGNARSIQTPEIAPVETHIATYKRISIMGNSGQKYDFLAWPLATRFRPLGAVYFVTKRSIENKTYRQSGSHQYIYIGQTDDLSAPLATETQLDRFARQGANCICVHVEADPERRLAATRDLMAGNSSSCNF